MKRKQLISDRTRFNWGFHDAARDAKDGNARLTHYLAGWLQGLRHVSPSFDKAYRDGYEYGLDYYRLKLPTTSSEPAWEARQRGYGKPV